MRRAVAAVAWAAVALAGGCEQPRTELVVRVDSEVAWGAGRRVQSVVLSVRRSGADGPLRSRRTTALGAEAGRQPLPLVVGVTAGDDTDTPVWIEALGCDNPNDCTADTAVVAQRAVVRFARGQTQELTLLLASACVGVTCASDQRCAMDGRCEAATRAQEMVRPFAGIGARGGDAAVTTDSQSDAATADVDASASLDRPAADASGSGGVPGACGAERQACCGSAACNSNLTCRNGRCAAPGCFSPGERCDGTDAGSCCGGYACNIQPGGQSACCRGPALVTTDPPVPCATTAECCGSVLCTGGVCACRRGGESCLYSSDCCGAMLCNRPGGATMGTCQCQGSNQACRIGGNDCCSGVCRSTGTGDRCP